MPGIAFFDVDKTLLAVNSARLWAHRELRTGRLSIRNAIRAAIWTTLYEMGFARIEAVIEDAVNTLSGQDEKELMERVTQFFQEEIASTFRPGAKTTITRHRDAGDKVALLTSTSSYLAEQIQTAVGADHYLSNEFETDEDGRFTGAPIKPLCYGPGKLVYAKRLASKLHIPMSHCHFYTDSYSDLPVMENVGFPVAVHPDPRLKRAAQKRGWPIERWS